MLEYADARAAAIASVLASPRLGDGLRAVVRTHLDGLESELLAQVLIAGLTPAELRGGHGLVYELLGPHEFVVDPLPNLVFTRDSSAWIGDQVAVASLAAPTRDREAALLAVLYRHHPGSPAPPCSTDRTWSRWPARTSCCSPRGCWPSGSASGPARPV